MRNPERIDKVIEAVRGAWKTVPDWRLGQLICNIGRAAGKMDSFFLEDEDLLVVLQSAGKTNDTDDPEMKEA